MDNVFLLRLIGGEQGTEGLWLTEGFSCRTIELPWKDNKPNVSCISDGIYIAKYHKSPKYGWCYHITDVEGRSWILTHWGNWAGDTTKGFRSNSNGCILLGKYSAVIHGQRAVALSKTTFRRWMSFMNKKDFILNIITV